MGKYLSLDERKNIDNMTCDHCHTIWNNEDGDRKKPFYIEVPTIGYGSFFDVGAERTPVVAYICPECFEKINEWLIKKYPYIDLKAFWTFEKKDVSEEYDVSSGTVVVFKYDYELFKMFLKFFPEAYYNVPISIFRKLLINIIAPLYK